MNNKAKEYRQAYNIKNKQRKHEYYIKYYESKKNNRVKEKEKRRIAKEEYYKNIKSKTCHICKQDKNIIEFIIRSDSPYKYKRGTVCEACEKERKSIYKRKLESKIRANAIRDREKARRYTKFYKNIHPDKVKKWGNNRSQLVAKQKDNSITQKEMTNIYYEFDNCPYCGCSLIEDNRSIDHIIPISKNGVHGVTNMLVCCKSCNTKKSNKTIDKWLNELNIFNRKRTEIIIKQRASGYQLNLFSR